MTRIQIHVAYGDRHYEVDTNISTKHAIGIQGLERNRSQLFDEIDRSVAKIKAAIEVNP